MSDAAELSVIFKGRDVGLRSLINALERELKQADKQTQATEKETEQLAKVQQRAANQALQLASSYARLDSAQGNAAAGAARLRAALEQNSNAGQIQINSAQQQILKLEQLGTTAQSTGGFLSQLSGISGIAGVALALPAVAAGAIELAKTGASAQLLEQRFQGLAAAAGESGDAILAALRKASGGEISDLNLQLAANKANLLGVATSADDLGTLMAIATDRAQQLGTTSTQAFNDLVTGLGRGSALILDNLGIIVDAATANQTYADSVGKTVAQLSEQEKKQALINAVVAQGNATLAATGGAVESNIGGFDRLGAAAENAANRAGAAIADRLAPLASGLGGVINAALGQATSTDQTAIIGLIEQLQRLTGRTTEATQAEKDFAATLLAGIGIKNESQVAAASAAASDAAFAATTDAIVDKFLAGQISLDQYNIAIAQVQQAQAQAATTATEHTVAVAGTTDALITGTGALDQEAASALLASVNAQALADEKQRLTEAAQTAAQAVLVSGGNIEAEAARLAASSSLVDQLTAAYLRLAAANGQAQLAADRAAGATRLAQQKSQTRDLSGGLGFNSPGRSGTSDVDQAIKGMQAAEKAAADLLKPKKPVKGARGGGSVASESAKLLKQEQDYQTKSQQQEQDHQDKLSEIINDASEKRAVAAQQFEQSSLDGRASFYLSLADIEDAGVQQALSAKFEEASAKAAEIAATTGPDAAEAYMDAATKAIESQSSIQQQIDEANKKGDSARAEYLTGVLAQQVAADQKRLDNIIAAGSAINNAQIAAWSQEEQAYAAHLDKMLATYQQKTGGKIIPGITPPGALGTPSPSNSTASSSTASPASTTTPSSATAQPVIDIATPAAVDQQTGALLGSLAALRAEVGSVRDAIAAVERAVGGLKQDRAFAST